MAGTENEKALNTSNPIGEEVMVEVAMPKSFKIKMVEASQLWNYKIWSGVFSLFTNILVGFFVAACTNTEPAKQNLLWWITGIFGFLTLGALVMTLIMNSQMKTQETIINLKASK
jgi:hypothetical protein